VAHEDTSLPGIVQAYRISMFPGVEAKSRRANGGDGADAPPLPYQAPALELLQPTGRAARTTL